MTSAKTSRKLFVLFLLAFMVLSLAACAGNTETTFSDSSNSVQSSEQPSNENSDLPENSVSSDDSISSDSNILVAYF